MNSSTRGTPIAPEAPIIRTEVVIFDVRRITNGESREECNGCLMSCYLPMREKHIQYLYTVKRYKSY